MNKLQLYIAKSGNVYRNLLNINPHEDISRHIRDIRTAVGAVDYDSDEKNVFYMLSAIAEGVFITIIRTIPPTPGHHLAAWIFVPRDIVADAGQIKKIVSLTTRKVSNREVSADDVAQLREAFGTEYPFNPQAPLLTATASGTGNYAWRSYGEASGLSLDDFWGRGLWQQSYLPFDGVLLIDDALAYTVNAVSLNRVPLGERAVILPPEKTGEGFTAHIFGRLLDRPTAGTLGADLQVMWRRPGFETVTVDEVIDDTPFTPSPVSTSDAHKTLTPSSFYVTSQKTRDIVTDCTIRVNGHEITPGGQHFTTDELRAASVVVTSEGHFTYTATIDLAATTRALIQLQEKRKVYRFELPLVSSQMGSPVRFDIMTKHTLDRSPIEGYATIEEIREGPQRTNHLAFTGQTGTLLPKLIYAAAGAVAGAVLTLACVWLCGGNGGPTLSPAANPDSVVPVTVPVAKAPQTPAEDGNAADSDRPGKPGDNNAGADAKTQTDADAKPATGIDEAIKYLDDNKIWTKEEMAKYAVLDGLYDDMNNFRVDRLSDHWGPVLSKSQAFAKVAKHAKLGRKKAKPDGTYNKDNDTRISLQTYLNRIDP